MAWKTDAPGVVTVTGVVPVRNWLKAAKGTTGLRRHAAADRSSICPDRMAKEFAARFAGGSWADRRRARRAGRPRKLGGAGTRPRDCVTMTAPPAVLMYSPSRRAGLPVMRRHFINNVGTAAGGRDCKSSTPGLRDGRRPTCSISLGQSKTGKRRRGRRSNRLETAGLQVGVHIGQFGICPEARPAIAATGTGSARYVAAPSGIDIRVRNGAAAANPGPRAGKGRDAFALASFGQQSR